MMTITLRSRMVCPHCDRPMTLEYFGEATGLKFICGDGCKAEYDVTLAVGQTTEVPICGAKRVQTFGR
jgi:hypothetical protein